ncbi:zinc permease [Nakamurella sp. A5-74]|uniref:Zinc permease n=1 Tax=Nakamurella sp. A5-74 TaxID=3158264 RepID=A0AAU8DL42_9ACTN
MGPGQITVLGAIAGFTILLGLPLGRLRSVAPRTRLALNGAAIGILVFLLWDVLSAGIAPVEAALEAANDDHAGWGTFIGYAALLVAGLALGLIALAGYEQWISGRRPSLGPGAVATAELTSRGRLIVTSGQQLALLIAIGIGVHNFAEGLAIGQSAAGGATDLALLLVIGFAAHNATEGFGIVGPTAGEPIRPSWKLLLMLGIIGGGPTFLGTLIGQSYVSDTLNIAFLATAAGSILYVILQLAVVAARAAKPILLSTALLGGFILGLGTDFLLDVAGG